MDRWGQLSQKCLPPDSDESGASSDEEEDEEEDEDEEEGEEEDEEAEEVIVDLGNDANGEDPTSVDLGSDDSGNDLVPVEEGSVGSASILPVPNSIYVDMDTSATRQDGLQSSQEGIPPDTTNARDPLLLGQFELDFQFAPPFYIHLSSGPSPFFYIYMMLTSFFYSHSRSYRSAVQLPGRHVTPVS